MSIIIAIELGFIILLLLYNNQKIHTSLSIVNENIRLILTSLVDYDSLNEWNRKTTLSKIIELVDDCNKNLNKNKDILSQMVSLIKTRG